MNLYTLAYMTYTHEPNEIGGTFGIAHFFSKKGLQERLDKIEARYKIEISSKDLELLRMGQPIKLTIPPFQNGLRTRTLILKYDRDSFKHLIKKELKGNKTWWWG